MALFEYRTYIAQYQTQDIKQSKVQVPPSTQAYKYGLQRKAEEIERKHIEQQVAPITVDKTAGDEGVQVAPPAHAVRMEHKPTEEVVIRKRVNTGDDGKDKNDAGHRCLNQIFFHPIGFSCRK